MNKHARVLSWFGKLPCVGDFCSHNMSEPLQGAIDTWLSDVMLQGDEKHGKVWMNAYYHAPMHGFRFGKHTLPALNGAGAVGIIMPSVDRAGRAFPFMLLEQIQHTEPAYLSLNALSQWFVQAHAVCASALEEDWSLDRLGDSLNHLPALNFEHAADKACSNSIDAWTNSQSDWYRIECSGSVQWVNQFTGLPNTQAFETLLGLSATP